MLALCRKMDAEGNTSCGTSGNYFTKEYKTLKNLVKYGITEGLPTGKYEVSLYSNPDAIYREPIKKFVQNVS